jgi:transcriptional regulator with XRE-family HTH domain
LAERAGLSARYVGGIERADVSASVTVLGRIADALEVEAHELVRAAPANARKKAAVGP